ncbi:MAG: hypothetical protein AB1578_01895 [Thermodesulfobacteriota bacterium]|jgi:hypothetical protein
MKNVSLALAALAALVGLVAAPPASAVWPAPMIVALDLETRVPDPYYVLSGPIETYRAYPFQDWVSEAFREYARQKSGALEEEGILQVRVEQLSTRFRAIGSAGEQRAERVYKTAWLRLEVSFLAGGEILARRDGWLEAQVTLGWHEAGAEQYYDFTDVLGAVIAKALAEADAAVEEALRASGRR